MVLLIHIFMFLSIVSIISIPLAAATLSENNITDHSSTGEGPLLVGLYDDGLDP